MKKFQTELKEIEISTLGLDNLLIVNSASNFIEVYLFAENSEEQHIIYTEEYNLLKIQFKIPGNKPQNKVFRKFITQRLNRARVVIKVPKNKTITLYGDEINVESKSYQGNLNFFIEKGILRLNNVQQNILIKLYAGTIYGSLKRTNIDVVSNLGKIKINDRFFKKKYLLKDKDFNLDFKLNSIKANVFLKLLKTI